MVVVVVVVVE